MKGWGGVIPLEGRVAAKRPGGVSAGSHNPDFPGHVPSVGQNVWFIDPHDFITKLAKIFVPVRIVASGISGLMPVAIDLHDQLRCQAYKVDDVGTYRRLLAEPDTVDLQRAQLKPKKHFAFREMLSQVTRLVAHFRFDARVRHGCLLFPGQTADWRVTCVAMCAAETTPPGRFAATLPSRGRDLAVITLTASPPRW